MLKIYYAIINQLPAYEAMQQKLLMLPLQLQQKIAAYKNPMDKVLRLCGKLLLWELVQAYRLNDEIRLADIAVGKNSKPYFNKPLYFNSAYAGNIAVCAATKSGDVGVDVEKIVPLDFTLYRDYFAYEEWDEINIGGKNLETFYSIWTQKEAVLKASGSGMYANLASFNVLSGEVAINGVAYYLKRVPVTAGYICHVASDIPHPEVDIKKINIFEG